MKILARYRFPNLVYAVGAFLLIAIAITVFCSSKVKADVKTLYPIADAYVYSPTPNTNYGSEDVIDLRNSTYNGSNAHSFLKFDFSTIPSNATITSATLSVFITDCEGETVTLKIGQVAGNWTESTITYKNEPSVLPVMSSTAVSCNSYDEFGFDAIQMVQNWMSGQQNYGFKLFSDATISFLRTFNSREYGGLSFQPQLQLIYILPAAPVDEDTTTPPADNPDSTNPGTDTPTGQQPTGQQPTANNPATPGETTVDDLPAFDPTVPEDWADLPIFSPLVGTFGMSVFPCLLLLCCCCLLFLLILIIILLTRRGNQDKNNTVQPVSNATTTPVEKPEVKSETEDKTLEKT